MKLIFLDIGQIQRFKCGADPFSVALGIGSGVSGLAGSILGNDTSEHNVSRQLNAQREENAKNRDWQTAEAEKNRQFQQSMFGQSLAQQTSEREASQQYQSDQWQNQFNQELQHRFDLPTGVNPAVYFSSHGAASGVGGSVSAPSNSAPGSPSGSMPGSVAGLNSVGYQPLNLQVPQLMDSLGSMMSGLANAKKAGVETSFLEQTMKDKIREAVANANMAELNAALTGLDKKIKESTLPVNIKRAYSEYEKLLSEIDLVGEKILTEQQEQELKASTVDLNKALRDYNKSAKNKIDVELSFLPSFITSQILANRGSAALSNAQAQTENEFRSTRGAILGLEYAIKNNEVEVSNATVKAAILSALQKAVQEKWHTKEAYTDYLIKQYKLDTQGVKDAMRILTGWIPFSPGLSD